MLGAIAGDVIGSVFEWHRTKSTHFPLCRSDSTFTDDTVLTIATAYSILHGADYGAFFKLFGRKYPGAGYGGLFYQWLFSSVSEPYYSFGNGSAMRVSPIGFAFDSRETVLEEAKRSAEVTHNHPEGIKGAQATALAIFLARKGSSKQEIRRELTTRFHYDLGHTIEEIRPSYRFDETCQGSVPQSIVAFFESENFEDALRKAISLGGDSDTMACITGGIAQAFYKYIPEEIVSKVRRRLPEEFLLIVDEFAATFSF